MTDSTSALAPAAPGSLSRSSAPLARGGSRSPPSERWRGSNRVVGGVGAVDDRRAVILLPRAVRVYFATGATNLRKSFARSPPASEPAKPSRRRCPQGQSLPIIG